MLRPNLVLDKDYYLVPSFVVNALDYVFDLFPARASIERRVLSKEKFLPSDSWPDVWGPPEDFPGDYFVEMYQVSVEVYSHSPPSKDWKIDSMGKSGFSCILLDLKAKNCLSFNSIANVKRKIIEK